MKTDAILGSLVGLFLVLLAALWWVAGLEQLKLFLLFNNYELCAAFISILVYIGVRFLNVSVTPRFSFLAIFAALNVFLNPVVINYVQWHLHSRFAVGIGSEELRSFSAGMLSFICGIVALIRILRSRRSLRGLPFAIVGIIGGAVWAVFWAQLYVRFVSGMARW
jgi:hypothetical protein